MKILMVIPYLGSGGAERVLSGLANDWEINKNCTIHLAILMEGNDFYNINENVKIHRLGYSPNDSGKFKKLFKLLFDLRSLIKDISPNVCLSFIRESNIITLLSTRGINTKVVISERDSPKAYVSKPYKIMRKILYPLSSGIIVQTEDYRKFIEDDIGFLNTEVIFNPVRHIPTEDYLRENIIICVGRLIPTKGHKYLIEAFSKCELKENWKLVILGDGLLQNDLQAQIKALNLSDKIELMGAVKNVDYWLAKASIFAFTSLSEGFPNALAEGMSASLPCVSFDCITGPKELIENGKNGYLVDLYDTDNFSKKLDTLMASEALRKKFGRNAKEKANTLDFKMISEKYFGFIIKTLAS